MARILTGVVHCGAWNRTRRHWSIDRPHQRYFLPMTSHHVHSPRPNTSQTFEARVFLQAQYIVRRLSRSLLWRPEVRPLEGLPANVRGWTLDVLRAIGEIGRRSFTLSDAYAYENRLRMLHPNNKNIRPKIRQQLQVLRDLGILRFLGAGQYRLVSVAQELRSA